MPWTKTARREYRRTASRYASDLTDREWALIAPFMPPPRRMGRPRTTRLRDVVDAILYMATIGCQWVQLPRDFPPPSTVQRYFHGWRGDGLWQTLRLHLAVVDPLQRLDQLGVVAVRLALLDDAPRPYAQHPAEMAVEVHRRQLLGIQGALVALHAAPAVEHREAGAPRARGRPRGRPGAPAPPGPAAPGPRRSPRRHRGCASSRCGRRGRDASRAPSAPLPGGRRSAPRPCSGSKPAAGRPARPGSGDTPRSGPSPSARGRRAP